MDSVRLVAATTREHRAKPSSRDQAPRPAAAPERSASPPADGATRSRDRVTAHPHFGAGRIRQVDAGDRVARRSASSGRPVAWLSLDPSDSEPATYWTYFVRALQAVAPNVGDAVLSLLHTSDRPGGAVVATLVNELSAMTSGVVLVLDDYHVIESLGIHEDMALLLEQLPPELHVVIATRADPALPLARLRARGELVEIRAADLRFTADEATAYLNGAMGLLCGVGRRRTRGADRGLDRRAPACRALAAGPDDSGFIAEFAGDDRYIVDYLVGRGPAAPARRSPELPARDLDPRPAERSAVRRRHRPGRRAGRCSSRSSGRTCSSSRSTTSDTGTATTTSSPMSCRRVCRPNGPSDCRTPSSGERLVRRERRPVRSDPPRAGRRGLRPSRRPDRAGHPRDAHGSPGGDPVALASGTPRRLLRRQASPERGVCRDITIRGRGRGCRAPPRGPPSARLKRRRQAPRVAKTRRAASLSSTSRSSAACPVPSPCSVSVTPG